jgi:excisionase family DNA binding protein
MPEPEQKDSAAHLLAEILKELRRSNDSQRAERTREILSLPEAANYLGQSEFTIRGWVRMRKIPFSKVNGAIKFRRSKLDRWIDRNEIAVIE